MLIILESITVCFVLLLVCVVGIANGPVGSVYFYEPEVQERVLDLGLTTKEKIRKSRRAALAALYIPILFFVPAMVYFVNGTRGFLDTFLQITAILLLSGLFDRIFIDWYWVGKTKAWIIPGTEDLMPYICGKTLIKKWIGMLLGFPVLAAILSVLLTLI